MLDQHIQCFHWKISVAYINIFVIIIQLRSISQIMHETSTNIPRNKLHNAHIYGQKVIVICHLYIAGILRYNFQGGYIWTDFEKKTPLKILLPHPFLSTWSFICCLLFVVCCLLFIGTFLCSMPCMMVVACNKQ